jgi:hypothetical protein
MGIQIHSHEIHRTIVATIQAGTIGKIKEVHSWSAKRWGDNDPTPSRADPIPAELNWNLWLGVAGMRPYLFTLSWYDGDKRPPQSVKALLGQQSLADQGSVYIGTEGVLYSPYIDPPVLFPLEKFKDAKLPNPGGNDHYLRLPFDLPRTMPEWTNAAKPSGADCNHEIIHIDRGKAVSRWWGPVSGKLAGATWVDRACDARDESPDRTG